MRFIKQEIGAHAGLQYDIICLRIAPFSGLCNSGYFFPFVAVEELGLYNREANGAYFAEIGRLFGMPTTSLKG